LLNIDANTELDIEFDTGVINYFKIVSSVNVSSYIRQYSGIELTVYFHPEINSGANKQLLIRIVFKMDVYEPVCNVSLLRFPNRRFRVR